MGGDGSRERRDAPTSESGKRWGDACAARSGASGRTRGGDGRRATRQPAVLGATCRGLRRLGEEKAQGSGSSASSTSGIKPVVRGEHNILAGRPHSAEGRGGRTRAREVEGEPTMACRSGPGGDPTRSERHADGCAYPLRERGKAARLRHAAYRNARAAPEVRAIGEATSPGIPKPPNHLPSRAWHGPAGVTLEARERVGYGSRHGALPPQDATAGRVFGCPRPL